MRHPWANIILFILLMVQTITGFYGVLAGAERFSWVLWLHGIGAYGLIFLLYWKSDIIFYAIRRKTVWTKARIGFAVTAILLLITIITGILWTLDGPIYLFGFSLVSLHIYISIPLMALMVWHSWKMRFVLKLPETFGRRLFIYTGTLSLIGAAAWRGVNAGKKRLQLEGATRRFTGSYEWGSFSPRFPSTSWIADYPDPIDQANWQLTIRGAVKREQSYHLADLRKIGTDQRTAILDCTGGWYTEQVWQGVDIARLLEQVGLDDSARSVTFRAVSGYQRRFSIEQAQRFMLALDVAGEPLRHGHGGPARLVADGRRGVEWVKWIAEIEVNRTSHLLQLPLPIR